VVLIKSMNEVDCVVHGTYYHSWANILQQGLSRNGQDNIICYSQVPTGLTGPKAFQLYIFLDIEKAMDDGIKFFKLGEQKVLSSGDFRGFISSKYFKKVVDSETGSVIFPSKPAVGPQAIPDKVVSSSRQCSVPNSQAIHSIGVGRGRIQPESAQQQPKPMEVFQNIWSQMEHPNAQMSQMLSEMLNISTDTDTSQKSQSSQSSTASHDSSRKEMTVQDLFSGAQNSRLIIEGDFNNVSVTRNHTESTVPVINTNVPHSTKKESRQQPDLLAMLQQAAETNDRARNAAEQAVQPNNQLRTQKSGSPVKSAFVPTQVIRKQTSRKPKYDEHQYQQQEENQQQQMHDIQQQLFSPQPQQPHQKEQKHHSQQGNVRPRRQKRNRLAVNFNNLPPNNGSGSSN